MGTRVATAIVAMSCGAIGVAAADPTASADADRLFEEGRALAKQNRHADACTRFTQSDALVRTFGTAVNLGDCAARDDQPDRAWELYDAAARIAERDGAADRARFARDRAAAIARRVATVVLEIAAPGPELTVRIADRALAPAAEVRAMVAPGDVEVVVTRPGAPALRRTVRGVAGEVVRVRIPDDARAPDPAGEPSGSAHTRGAIVEVNLGGGVVTDPGAAMVFGAMAGGWLSPRVIVGGRISGIVYRRDAIEGVMDYRQTRVATLIGPAIRVRLDGGLWLGAGAGIAVEIDQAEDSDDPIADELAAHTNVAPGLELRAGYALGDRLEISVASLIVVGSTEVTELGLAYDLGVTSFSLMIGLRLP